ncbi:MAG: phosphoribosyltransferase [Archaeoglobaceae archaeon]
MRYVAVNFDYVDRLTRKIAFEVIEDGYEPDCIVALAKGGWFVGRILSDYLGVQNLESLDVRGKGSVSCRRALIVDDLINTGTTMRKALQVVEAEEVRTAALFMLRESDFIPDYFAEYLWDYSWIIFPWNFVEDVSELVLNVLKERGEATKWTILSLLLSKYGLDPLSIEVSMPGRFDDVLSVLEARGKVERVVVDGRVYWRFVE